MQADRVAGAIAELLYERYLRFGGDGRLLLHVALIGGLLAEHRDGKLRVVQTTATIPVVGVKERAKLILGEVHASLLQDSLKLGKIDGTRVHDVEVLEHFHETGFFRHFSIGLLNELVLELFLEPLQQLTNTKLVRSC